MLLKKRFFVTSLHLILLFLLIATNASVAFAQSAKEQLSVRVIESDTKNPIPNAIIMDGRHVYVADESGFTKVPYNGSGKIVLSVRFLGFKEIKSRVFTVKGNLLTIRMKPEVNMLQSVNVAAQRRHTTAVQQVSIIDTKTLEKSSSLSVSQLLEKVPGVSSISSGNSIGKPVIQGMHSSRILLINDGVRLESQSWGVDHAPEVDHTASSIVEVIKGAESIRYGYGAVGGVILFNQAKLPYGHDKLFVSGIVNTGFSTNARGFDGMGTLNFGWKKFGARVHALYKQAGDYSTAQYRLNNTGYKTISLSGTTGYQGDNVTVTLEGSLFYSRNGIYYGSKVSDLDQLMARFERGRPEESTIRPFTYYIEPPFQQSQHVTFKGDLSWDITKQQNILFRLSYQENLRQEFENRKKAAFSWLPVQDLRLTTTNAEAIWSADWGSQMTSQAGLSAMYQINYNIPGTRQPAFIPNFAALTTGFFFLHKMTLFDKLILSAGMRYDMRGLDINGYTSLASFKYYTAFKIYSNLTGNLAAHYQFNDNYDARVNIGWAWRPPDVNELYANGLHHGTYWVVGNPNLESEKGYKAILGGRYRNDWLYIEPSFFYQRMNNYIYDNIGTGGDRFHIHPSGKYPKFIYGQDNVRIMGGDFSATVKPMKGLKINAKGEWIFGRNISQDNWLPFMPSDKYGLSGEYEFKFGADSKWSASIGLDGTYVTKQTRFDPLKDLVPEAPPAYFLLGGSAEASTKFANGNHLKFMIIGDNILNSLYKEYTDRFRYYAHERGAQFTLKTIYTF